ncbi:CSEP0191 putative effector protein [Blumeria hordei DH14]|uniref:CSEP0191 putative effector protein n=1 Tax=Blumeria graminis f. sp. hordei (strain DH14) TaxID=546991 RepID=N1JFE2_BLUG1|nr:CSEP0191 putative effector protein [Blumeria hordei DH14]
MRITKTLVFLQSASFFVATISGYRVTHIAEESKAFSCSQKRIDEASIHKERMEAIDLLKHGRLTVILPKTLKSYFEANMETQPLMFDDDRQHHFYIYDIKSLWSHYRAEEYNYLLMTSLLFDDNYRLCAILTDESWNNHHDQGPVMWDGKKSIKSSCIIVA